MSIWSPFSSPELQSLPARERRRQFRAWFGGVAVLQVLTVILVLVLAFGMIITGVRALPDAWNWSQDLRRWIFWTTVAVSVVSSILILIWLIRAELTDFVKRNIPSLTFCSGCGYDLRASHGDLCPECGAYVVHTSGSLAQTKSDEHRKLPFPHDKS